LEPLARLTAAEAGILYRPQFKYLAVSAVVAGIWSVPAISADPSKSLKDIERSLGEATSESRALNEKVEKTEAELKALKQRSVAVVANARDHAFTLIKLEEQLEELDHRAAAKKQSLNGQKKQLGSLIAALQRIALHPPVALIALPASPADTIRSALLLRGTVPEIETRAQVLREDIKALSKIRAAITAARQKIQSEQRDLMGERRALATLTSKKLKLAKTTSVAQQKLGKRAQALGSKAKNLKDLITRLAADQRKKARADAFEKKRIRAANRAKPPTPAPNRKIVTSAPMGRFPDTQAAKTKTANLPRFSRRGLPVAGRIAVSFGGKDHNGQKSRGISIRARPNATVIAPSSGTVVFAGPFRGLGNLLIIEYGRQYHLLLGRLARIDVLVGEKVLAGEPVGIILFIELTGTTLYLELRRNGQPINPLPWLAARRDRKRG